MYINMNRKRIDSISPDTARFEVRIPFVLKTEHAISELQGDVDYEQYDKHLALRFFSERTGHKKALDKLHDIYEDLRYILPQQHKELLDSFEEALENMKLKLDDAL